MEKFTIKICDSSSSIDTTIGSPPSSSEEVDHADNVKYMNTNFVDNSETSCQVKGTSLNIQKLINVNLDQDQNNQQQQKTEEKRQDGGVDTQPDKERLLEGSRQLNALHEQNVDDFVVDGGEDVKYPPTPIRPPPSEIFSPVSPRSLKCKEEDNEPIIIPSKPLKEVGFNSAEIDGWQDIPQAPKQHLYRLLRKMIDTFVKPNVQIKIGPVHFNCHMLVLQCYSEFFMEYGTEVLIQLPEEEVTPSAFMMTYEWMLADAPLIQREGIAELFKAANFLRIKELINQCWICLDDDTLFREDSAFFLYLEARKCGGLENLEQLMMMRICRFFLTLVASKEFLELEPTEIVKLLNSNFIGVNTEIEVFMSGIRWLNHDWEKRKQYVPDVIKAVRFGLFPPYFLMTLTKKTDCEAIDRILDCPQVSKMIMDGMAFSTIQYYYSESCEQFSGFLERHKLMPPMERQWVSEKGACCPCNTQYITYDSFLDYLKMIQSMGTEHWQTLELRKTLERGTRCCNCPDMAPPPKPIDTNFLCEFAKSD